MSTFGRALFDENDRAERGIFDGNDLINPVRLVSPYDDDLRIDDGDLRP